MLSNGRVKKAGCGRGQLDRGRGWGGAREGARAGRERGVGMGQEHRRLQKPERVQGPRRGREMGAGAYRVLQET